MHMHNVVAIVRRLGSEGDPSKEGGRGDIQVVEVCVVRIRGTWVTNQPGRQSTRIVPAQVVRPPIPPSIALQPPILRPMYSTGNCRLRTPHAPHLPLSLTRFSSPFRAGDILWPTKDQILSLQDFEHTINFHRHGPGFWAGSSIFVKSDISRYMSPSPLGSFNHF